MRSAKAYTNNIRILKDLEDRLKNAGFISASSEAMSLLSHFSSTNRMELFTAASPISKKAERQIHSALKKRIQGLPLGYIMGQAPFYGRMFTVGEGVLVPRPETERLVEEVLKVIDSEFQGRSPEIIDLGTGSGCIAASLTLERPVCRMTALEVSSEALRIARKNFKSFGLRQKIRLVKSRFFSGIQGRYRVCDILVSNPPYIPKDQIKQLPEDVRREPVLALDGGPDGLDAIRKILKDAPKVLRPGGWIFLELGKGQHEILADELKYRREFESVRFEKDLNGIERILIARMKVHG